MNVWTRHAAKVGLILALLVFAQVWIGCEPAHNGTIVNRLSNTVEVTYISERDKFPGRLHRKVMGQIPPGESLTFVHTLSPAMSGDRMAFQATAGDEIVWYKQWSYDQLTGMVTQGSPICICPSEDSP